MDISAGVMIFAETAEGKLSSITKELMGLGTRLAGKLEKGLSAVLLGAGTEPLATELVNLGADAVYLADDAFLENYNPEQYASVIEHVIQTAKPAILLMGQTSRGADMAPRLAFKFRGALAMDCVELDADSETGLLTHTRPVYGGIAMARARSRAASLQVVTVRAKSQDPAEPADDREGEIIAVGERARGEYAGGMKFLRPVAVEADEVNLEEANIIVAGGRGVGSTENFKRFIEGFARILGGVPGASRGALDSDFAPANLQIGLTGKIVSPQLYVAIGISGMVQHMTGCSSSKTIVGINTDPDASIFKYAHFGIVGDFEQVVPALMQKCEELLKN
ncbi:MAG: electron transfer flavoprotein subunit alpha/FixB family protein [Candidatus Eiseniibacteriota bacterium]|nr:MAG: electron transfer flavoprotein subunit alpha/FixB family protein [Candidatus Eisenbacteria bacterium]